MKTWIRRSLLGLATLALLGGGAVLVGEQLALQRSQRHIDVNPQPVALRSDPAAVERGRYLYTSRGCGDCHGADGAGRSFVQADGLHLAGANITPGEGSVVTAYRPLDWVRTLRHGVKPDGTPLRVMPSEDYNRLTDDDLASIVAYVRQLPPARGGAAVVQLPLPARVMYGFGLIPDAADKIDHRLPPSTPVAEGVTVEHGRYVAQMCKGCHGTQLAGGRIPGAPPDWPAASSLLPGADSALERYPDAASMVSMFRTGQRPDGTPVRVMPFQALGQLSDTDARALHLYLKSLSAG
jgi:mono/diheme cytochrome c family protein